MNRAELEQRADYWAGRYGIPPQLFRRIVDTETGGTWRTDLTSPAGAYGLTQIMDATARQPGYNIRPAAENWRDDPNEQLRFGANYLRAMYDEFGSWDLAAAAYNGGPGRAQALRAGQSIPEETRNYVRYVNQPRFDDRWITRPGSGGGGQQNDTPVRGLSAPHSSSYLNGYTPISPGNVVRMNANGIRRLPLSDNLNRALQTALAPMGLSFDVFSAGQASNRPGEGTGSTRHNDGNAADGYFYMGDRRLRPDVNEQDRQIVAMALRRLRGAGLTGVGHGPGYMGDGSFHVGFGPVAVWGDNGKSANAVDWVQDAWSNPLDPGDVPDLGGAPGGRSGATEVISTMNTSASGGWRPPVEDPETARRRRMGNRLQYFANAAAQMYRGQGVPQRVSEGQNNRTIEWLISQGRDDLAQQVYAGVLTGREAAALVREAPEGRQSSFTSIGNGYIMDTTTGEVRLAYTPPGEAEASEGYRILTPEEAQARGLPPTQVYEINEATGRVQPVSGTQQPEPGAVQDDVLSAAGPIRTYVRGALQNAKLVQEGYQGLQAIAASADVGAGVSDYALAVAFAKILDPGSVAREGEVAAVQNAGGALATNTFQALKSLLNEGEGRFTDTVRQQILATAGTLANQRLAEANKVIEHWREVAPKYGVPWELISSDDEFEPFDIPETTVTRTVPPPPP